MNSWSNIYYLKSDTNNSDIWNCIKKCFLDSDLPDETPKNYSFETDQGILFWHSHDDENEYAEFCFIRTDVEQKNTIKIVFDNNVHQQEYGEVHALFYEETAENADLFFYDSFFASLKKFVPKCYIPSQIYDDRELVKSNFARKLTRVQTEEDINDIVKELNSALNSLLNPRFRAGVQFYANKDGIFFIPEEWIAKLAKELWFLNANFIKSYGLVSSINKEILFGKRISNKKDQLQESLLNQFKEIASKFFGTGSIIRGMSYNENGECVFRDITFDDENTIAANDDDTYKDLKNQIIKSIDFNYSIKEKRKKYMSWLLDEDVYNKRVLQEKTQFQLKKVGFDEDTLKAIKNENKSLKDKNIVLNEELKNLREENEELKKKILYSEKNEETVCNEVKKSQKANDFLIENEELKKIIKTLHDEISNLSGRISVLEKKKEKIEIDVTGYVLQIPCSKKELYDDEIKDYLYNCLYSKIMDDEKKLPQNEESEVSRKKDVIRTLIEEKNYDCSSSETSHKLERIERILKATNKPALNELESEGFKRIENAKNHPKVFFYDEHYQITFSLSPSDERVPLNKMNEIKRRFFLV